MKRFLPLIALLAFFNLTGCSSGNKVPETIVPEKPTETGIAYSNVEDPYRKDVLTAITKDEVFEPGCECGYIDSKGDTVIPIGTYGQCFTEIFRTYAYFYDEKKSSDLVAIDRKGRTIFEAYLYDNGPDYTSEGLFRIKRNGKIGYANENGEIVIQPNYACADGFENGKARVAIDCDLVKDGEHTTSKSESWIHIDKTGKTVK